MEIKGVTKTVCECIRDQIITCQINGGQKLNENQLSSEFNISRPPLREAFQILEQEHFIVSIPRKGRYVVEITEDNYEKIHEARSMIECYVIDLLKDKNVRSLPMVDLALKKVLKNPTPPNDPHEKWHYFEGLAEFHVKLVNSAENEILNHFYKIIRSNISRYQYWLRVVCLPHLFRRNVIRSLTQEHSKILDLIKRGEFDEAKDCLKSHMDGTWRLMKKYLLKTSPENCKTLI